MSGKLLNLYKFKWKKKKRVLLYAPTSGLPTVSAYCNKVDIQTQRVYIYTGSKGRTQAKTRCAQCTHNMAKTMKGNKQNKEKKDRNYHKKIL